MSVLHVFQVAVLRFCSICVERGGRSALRTVPSVVEKDREKKNWHISSQSECDVLAPSPEIRIVGKC